jgi:hypothetical protein
MLGDMAARRILDNIDHGHGGGHGEPLPLDGVAQSRRQSWR